MIICLIFLIFLINSVPAIASGEPVSDIASSNVLIGSKNPTACLKQLKATSEKYEKTRVANNEFQKQLAECRSTKIGITDKLGILAMGAGLQFINYNPLGLIVVGFIIITQ